MKYAPQTKVGAGVLAGALTAILAWGVKEFGGVDIPTEIGIAISTVITFFVQMVYPEATDGPEEPAQGV